MRIISGEFRRKVTLLGEEFQAKNRMLNGRQLMWVAFQSYKRNDFEVGMTEFRDLQNICIKGDNLVAFMTDWDSCLYGMKKEPEPQILESLFTDQVKQCKHFEQA